MKNLRFQHKMFLSLISLLIGCAGPTSPFGKMEPFNLMPLKISKNKDKGIKRSFASIINHDKLEDVTIKIYPERQLLHDRSQLEISIYDPTGLTAELEVKIFYDNKEVTKSFLDNSQINLSESGKLITYKLQDFRLIPSKDNKIIIGVRRNPISPIFYKEYQQPNCQFRHIQKLVNLNAFESKSMTIEKLEKIALNKNINPNFLAGLVAQESAFNPNAVSYAKAIGLTQVTPIAEKHILENHPLWPSHKKSNIVPVPILKSLIMLGSINSTNEWRLNKRYSLIGGAEFLSYIENYWNKEENSWLIHKIFGTDKEILNDIILASYNSGSYRVKQSIRRKGKKWLEARELKEAKKYVKRVKSYCYHFSKNSMERI